MYELFINLALTLGIIGAIIGLVVGVPTLLTIIYTLYRLIKGD